MPADMSGNIQKDMIHILLVLRRTVQDVEGGQPQGGTEAVAQVS